MNTSSIGGENCYMSQNNWDGFDIILDMFNVVRRLELLTLNQYMELQILEYRKRFKS